LGVGAASSSQGADSFGLSFSFRDFLAISWSYAVRRSIKEEPLKRPILHDVNANITTKISI
jgi:hypothetical protein